MNNCTTFFGPDRRPIVEFAVDDSRKLDLRTRSQKQEVAKVKKPRWEKKKVASADGEEDEAASVASSNVQASDAPPSPEHRKLSKAEKKELKRKAVARAEIKAAKRSKRAAKRAQIEAAGRDDDLEVLVTDYMGRKKAKIAREMN